MAKHKKDCLLSKTFPVDIYKHGIRVVFCKEDELREAAANDGVELGDDVMEKAHKSEMVTVGLENGDVMIWGRSKPSGSYGKAVLAHEIFHATGDLLRNIGINHTEETEEVYAYLIEDLTFRIFNWLS